MSPKALEIRERALADLYFFACLVNPGYVYGNIHKEIYKWLQDYTLFGDADSNKLIMLPRAHLKSHMVATTVAWIVTRHPEVTILYLSATADLAETQLYAIKNIFESDVYQRFFPEYIKPEVGLREKWTSWRISIDHPERKKQSPRDATISSAGLTTNTTGWHADIIVADDLVIPENAYTENGRADVAAKASQFTSIRNPGGFTIACGTRYHPSDVYGLWKEQTFDVFNDEGEIADKLPVWDIKEYAVEQDGLFLWPRTVRKDGKVFGFDRNVLSRIRAEYEDITQFYAQYYNDPNDPSSDRISRDKFQYYDRRKLKKEGSHWFYGGNRLNIYAAVDFAYSLSKAADFSTIAVVGVNADGDYFVLDIDRFKTNKTIDYFNHVRDMHSNWKFKLLRAEVTAAQEVIVEALKDHIREAGMTIAIDKARPNRTEGSKEERIAAALEHLYDSNRVWHFEGGWTPQLEEELVQQRPKHDDIKDALAAAITIAVKPFRSPLTGISDFLGTTTSKSRFGGVPYR